MSSLVAVVRVDESIEAAVKKAVSLAGGMESVVTKGEKVYLKPNFVAPRDSSVGVTTDLRVIRSVAEDVRRCGGAPILFETPAIEFDRDTVFDVLGVRKFARENDIGLMDHAADLISVPVPGGTALKSVKIPRCLLGAKIINLPKLKTHVATKMTCGAKNLMGLLPDSEKRRMHVRGIDASIADLNGVFRPAMTVVDAVTCLEGDGPSYGDRVDLGLVAAGKDVLAVDKVCCGLIGMKWQDVEYLATLDGRNKGGDIRVVGEPVEKVAGNFRVPNKGALFHAAFAFSYALDVPFSRVFGRSLHRLAYGTGYVGTVPRIDRAKCDICGSCLKVCPIPRAVVIEGRETKIDYKRCVRCLKCYENCAGGAISVKGISRPGRRKA